MAWLLPISLSGALFCPTLTTHISFQPIFQEAAQRLLHKDSSSRRWSLLPPEVNPGVSSSLLTGREVPEEGWTLSTSGTELLSGVAYVQWQPTAQEVRAVPS